MPETETDPKVAALAAVLDPDVFDDDKPKSTRQAALIQWAARRYMATEKAERAIAAGWVSPEEAKAREAAARREALLEAAVQLDALPSYRSGRGFMYSHDIDFADGRDEEAERIADWLRVLAETERDEEPCSCGSRNATSLTPGEQLHHSPDGCTIERGGEDGR